MPFTATRPPSRRLAAILAVLACAAIGQARSQTLEPATDAPTVKHLLVLPTDDADAPSPPSEAALTTAEAAALPLSLHLGMSPEQVNARLAHPLASVAASALGRVNYFGPDPVAGFTIDMSQAGSMKPVITSCFSPKSLIVFQFVARRLYGMLFALAPDANCPDASGAADDLFQHLLAVPDTVMPSEHYRRRGLDIVDVWDATVTSIVHQRWGTE